MPRTVARNEELPKLHINKTWFGLVTSTGTTVLIPGNTHPRMRLVSGAYTPSVVGT